MAQPAPQAAPLEHLIHNQVVEGTLYEKLDGERVRCFACGHRCVIPKDKYGICLVRYNTAGKLYVPHGYVGALQLDPVEKKPFFHAYPGSQALSFGMLGCDYHCSYCQNWLTSQALRDPHAGVRPQKMTAAELCDMAQDEGARIVTSTYNEPLITSEWAVEIFKEAKQRGLVTSYVSNGNGTPEVLNYIKPWVDLYKVDLKGFQDKHYRELGGTLKPVVETIERLYAMGIWLEIVTLVIPDFNDSDEELRGMARFLAGISKDIPWHVTAYHRDYKMRDHRDTGVADILRAAEIGRAEGLRYVYPGNRPGQVGGGENTYCPGCKTLLIERFGFKVLNNHLNPGGHCPQCSLAIPGRWD